MQNYPWEDELRQERNAFENSCFTKQRQIDKLRRQLREQHRYIEELEKQLEHAAPGLLAEVRDYLQHEEENRS
jgi:uncharacterized coiled-coil DUF342 family protein